MYHKKKIIIFLGPPGAGKGTQAMILSSRNNYNTVSTGDILRKNVENNTDLGRLANVYMKNGELVPDNIILGIIKDYFDSFEGVVNGFILDGFPRTIEQAVSLDKILSSANGYIDIVVYINVDQKEIIKRNSNRRICPLCQKVYNLLVKPPKNDLICDLCKVSLRVREDDDPEIIKQRLSVYREKTEPLIEFYNREYKVLQISGNDLIDEVTKKLEKAINDQ